MLLEGNLFFGFLSENFTKEGPLIYGIEDVWEMKSGEAIFKPLKTLHIGLKVLLMLQIKT